jgi:hypothetical protein
VGPVDDDAMIRVFLWTISFSLISFLYLLGVVLFLFIFHFSCVSSVDASRSSEPHSPPVWIWIDTDLSFLLDEM